MGGSRVSQRNSVIRDKYAQDDFWMLERHCRKNNISRKRDQLLNDRQYYRGLAHACRVHVLLTDSCSRMWREDEIWLPESLVSQFQKTAKQKQPPPQQQTNSKHS